MELPKWSGMEWREWNWDRAREDSISEFFVVRLSNLYAPAFSDVKHVTSVGGTSRPFVVQSARNV